MIDEIHAQLAKMKIPHLCHYSFGGGFDLTRESIVCTECRIQRGEFSLADIVLGRADPMDERAAWDKAIKEEAEDKQLRKNGKLPKHAIYNVRKDNGEMYARYTCFNGNRASGPVKDDRICFSCKESVDL